MLVTIDVLVKLGLLEDEVFLVFLGTEGDIRNLLLEGGPYLPKFSITNSYE